MTPQENLSADIILLCRQNKGLSEQLKEQAASTSFGPRNRVIVLEGADNPATLQKYLVRLETADFKLLVIEQGLVTSTGPHLNPLVTALTEINEKLRIVPEAANMENETQAHIESMMSKEDLAALGMAEATKKKEITPRSQIVIVFPVQEASTSLFRKAADAKTNGAIKAALESGLKPFLRTTGIDPANVIASNHLADWIIPHYPMSDREHIRDQATMIFRDDKGNVVGKDAALKGDHRTMKDLPKRTLDNQHQGGYTDGKRQTIADYRAAKGGKPEP